MFGQVSSSITNPLSFKIEDIAELYFQQEGEYDGIGPEQDWCVIGRLKSGRYFYAYGGCGYTGWDCLASNYGASFDTVQDLWREIGDGWRYLWSEQAGVSKSS
jgi:hypothetical protein